MPETIEERIKQLKYSGSFTMTNRDGPGPIVSSVQKSGFDWLIEQAERVTELEKEVNGLYWRNEWLKSQEENERLRGALKEIAKGAGDFYEDEMAQIALESLEGVSHDKTNKT